MWEYTTTGPTKLKPLDLSSLLIFFDSSVSAGISFSLFHEFLKGSPSTKPHNQEANFSSFSRRAKKALALDMAAEIFCLLRMIPLSRRSLWISPSPKADTFSGSNSMKASLKLSLFLRTVSQLKPA